MPLKDQDAIHDFFDNKDKEFIAVCPGEGKYQLDHVRYAYPLLKFKAYRNSIPLKVLNEVLVILQRLFAVKRSRTFEIQGWRFYDGWQWFSITDDFAHYVLENESIIGQIFCKAKAPDEMFMQTLIMNSPFRDKLACRNDYYLGTMRLIDWNRGRPYVFRRQDMEELTNSPCLFARKFDEKVDENIIDELYDYLKK